MSYFSKRALRWAAPVVLVGAVGLAACGNSDSTESVRTNAVSGEQVSGLDNHLDLRAAEIASQRAGAARLAAQAERYERSAHFASQASTYSTRVPTNSDANLPNVFEAGNRAIQMTQSPAYVWQQQHRADSGSSGSDSYDEFVPGSRHMPTR